MRPAAPIRVIAHPGASLLPVSTLGLAALSWVAGHALIAAVTAPLQPAIAAYLATLVARAALAAGVVTLIGGALYVLPGWSERVHLGPLQRHERGQPAMPAFACAARRRSVADLESPAPARRPKRGGRAAVRLALADRVTAVAL